MAADIALRVDHVSKKFRKGELYDSLRDLVPSLIRRAAARDPMALGDKEFWALQDVSFEVARGEAFGVIGSNGAGKSTILKLLSGILRPTSGAVVVNGTLSALIEVSAGFHPDLTGRENIYLNGTILGLTRATIRSKFDQIVEFSGLADFIDTPVKRYSSGMFARLGFAVAAHVDPDVLIVDEVLSVGDMAFQRRCVARMQEVISSGATVLFVSHNLRAVTELCQRAVLLEHGKVVTIGPSDDVVRAYTESVQERRAVDDGRPVRLKDAVMRTASGETRAAFRTGEQVTLTVRVEARQDVPQLSLVLAIYDESFGMAFSAATERMLQAPFSLKAGEAVTLAVELTLHLAAGSYRADLHLYRYDIQREFDHWPSAVKFFVNSDTDVRGVANLYPKFLPPAPDGTR